MEDAYRHCEALVRTVDRDRYLACLFLPAEVRPQALALYAFNTEIASVRERAREPLAGEVRLQWWRDALAGKAAGDVARNPVAQALLDTLDRRRLPREAIEALISARRFDLYDDVMKTGEDLEGYVRATSSTLFELVGRLLGGEDARIAEAAAPAGLAFGITGLLRALALHASRGQVFLPEDLLSRFGVARTEITSGQTTPSLLAALHDMRAAARRPREQTRALIGGLPAAWRPAFLPLALVDGYLARMERPGYDPLRTPVEVPQWRRQWTLWRASRRGL